MNIKVLYHRTTDQLFASAVFTPDKNKGIDDSTILELVSNRVTQMCGSSQESFVNFQGLVQSVTRSQPLLELKNGKVVLGLTYRHSSFWDGLEEGCKKDAKVIFDHIEAYLESILS